MLRIGVALKSDYILQSDEIFQYLEQAHRLAFGYGHVPWEYRYGLRSWLVPGSLSLLLSAFQKAGLGSPAAYIPLIKVLLCCLSISVVYCCYIIGRQTLSERVGRMAAVMTALWYELVFFAHKPTPEILAMYALLGALACIGVGTRKLSVFAGVLAALALALRFQYFPALAVAGFFALKKLDARSIGYALGGFGAVVLLAGALDWLTWGHWFVSFYNYYLFNQTYNISSSFGVRPVWYYAASLAITSGGLMWLAPLGARRGFEGFLALACGLSIVLVHSAIAHKEYRFVIAAIPLLLISLASLVDRLLRYVPSIGGNRVAYAALPFALWSVIGATGRFPGESHIYNHPIYAQQGILTAYAALHDERDLQAIFVTFNQYAGPPGTGGYYYLHRNVPIYFPWQLRFSGLDPSNAFGAVSHVVCERTDPPIPGFETIATFQDVDVRRRSGTIPRLEPLKTDYFRIWSPGIDGVIPCKLKPYP